ncbi:MAG TPA: hypothetical protein VN541_08215 [Tepidisphaeraceae bacterium]|nr:hypothetical protein [Tepidisphaeraceae bacterium]
MSYAYELAEEASRGLGELESWLAEEVLDELEMLVSGPLSHKQRAPGGFVHDFVREQSGSRYYVFLTIVWDHTQQILRVSRIGQYVHRGPAST